MTKDERLMQRALDILTQLRSAVPDIQVANANSVQYITDDLTEWLAGLSRR